ncbi:hypothetical protein [Desulfonema limicola]|nr:hypothetical protein [Desulfonema limicola]
MDGNGLIEVIQVKSFPKLVFSKLFDSTDHSGKSQHPAKVEPFFRRAVNLLKTHKLKNVKVVNFGDISPEMLQAWKNTPLPANSKAKKTSRQTVKEKFTDKGFSHEDIDLIFSKVELVSLDEKEVELEILDYLANALTGIDKQNAFDLFTFWIYLASEQQREITQNHVIEKINGIGKFLSYRLAHHAEWYNSIRPIENIITSDEHKKRLEKEFYEGVSARYEHILAGFDLQRYDKLRTIHELFQKNNTVIIHAASGQGKSTLAYRFLHNYYPETWRYTVELIENRQHALSIANALSGYASALEAPIIVYLDVRPRYNDWPELVWQIGRHPYIKILVTIREEDFRRANLPLYELSFSEIDLTFNKEEAIQIFDRFSQQKVSEKYLDFDEAWDDFKGNGPLMEFVFLLTQTKTLQNRLVEQIQRIRNEVREKKLSPDELHFLRLSAAGTAYEARLNTRKLLKSLDLPEPSLTLELFEREYLIRMSEDRQYIEALHPIRSQIILDLLTNEVDTWTDTSQQVLPFLLEQDLEIFLLSVFAEHIDEYQPILETLYNFTPETWTGIGGILRSLLWAGIRDYVESNRPLIQAAVADNNIGKAWWLIFDFDITDQMNSSMIDVMWERIPQKNKNKIIKMQEQQLPKSEAFKYASQWLISLREPETNLITENDWINSADTLFWTGYLNIAPHIETWLTDANLEEALNLPLNVLADISMALYWCNKQRHETWIAEYRMKMEDRLMREYRIIALEEIREHQIFKIHFPTFLPWKKNDIVTSYDLDSMERIHIIHRLFPQYKRYDSQGYGQNNGYIKLPFDSSVRNIPRENLNPSWAVLANHIAMSLAKRNYRPDNWPEYVNQIIMVRQNVVYSLSQLNKGITKFLEKKKALNIYQHHIEPKSWDKCIEVLGELPDFPKISLDKWGFVTEGSKDIQQQKFVPNAIILQKYKKVKELQRSYLGALKFFFKNAIHVIKTNIHTGKKPLKNLKKREKNKELQKKGIKTDSGHISVRNLWEALLNLKSYQTEFRKLFAHFVESDVLSELEKNEQELLYPTWQLWYFFAYKPNKIITKAEKKVPIQISSAKRRLDEKICKALEKISSETVNAVKLNCDMCWKDASALWIQLDIHNPIDLYEKFQNLVLNLKKAFGPNNFQSLISYIIEESYEYVIIIPTVRAKLIHNLAWPLQTSITLFSDNSIENNLALYMMQAIPSSILKALNFEFWEHKDIEWANQLLESFAKTMALSAQVSDLNTLPELNGITVNNDILGEYSKACSDKISQYIQDFINANEILINRFNSLSESEKSLRNDLSEALSF